MSSYYLSLLVLSCLGLIATALGGVMGASWHLQLALPTAMVVVALHSLVILFILIGTRLVREGVNNCGLHKDFLERSNVYFRQVSGLFLSVAGAFSIVAAAVLGYGNRAFGFPPEVHLLTGLLAAGTTFVSIPLELGYLKGMERLLDSMRATLDAADVERAADGKGAVDEDHVPYKDSPSHLGLFIVVAPVCVYLYQLLVLWHGDFERVSIHPYVEVSILGGVLWWRGRQKETTGDSE